MDEKYLPTTPEGRRWRFVEKCLKAVFAAAKVGRFGLEGDAWLQAHRELGTPRERLLAEITDLEHAIAALKQDLIPCPSPACNCNSCRQRDCDEAAGINYAKGEY